MRIKSRHHLKGSDVKRILSAIGDRIEDPDVLRKASMELAETDEGFEVIIVNGRPLLMIIDGEPFFTVLGAIELSPKGRTVVVDSGAVRFIANGADVMGPGIVHADPEIEAGDLVVVVEERHRKPLAVGRALKAGPEMKGEGKAVESIHHVGDRLWKSIC